MFLCSTKITKDDLEITLQNYVKTDAKLEKAEAIVISNGLGFLSDVMRVDLSWNTKDVDLPNRIIVKAPKMDNMDEFVQKMGAPKLTNPYVQVLHNFECKAYKILKQDRPVPIPNVYGCWPITDNHPGVIVMEDLTDRAGIIDNIAKGVTLDQWKNVVASLADLHAWSLTTDTHWRQELSTMEDISHLYKDFEKTTYFGLQQIKEKYPEYFGNVNEVEFKKVLDTDNMLQYQAKFRTILDDVMLHGDTWINNIMFSKNSDGTLSDNIAAFIDWQMCMKGCGFNDFTCFETWCVNHKLRRDHSKQMLQFYYNRMKTKAGSRVKANFEQFENVYKEAFMFNGLFFVAIIDGLMNSVARVNEDKTGWRRKEMLERAKAVYEDATIFGGWD